jgi:iron complex transport system substrate-binding protein
MLTAIGKSELTVGVSGIDFISDKYVNDHRDKVRDVGYDNNIDYEMLIALAPDIVLLYGINAASAMELKLRELGIPYAYIGEYVEPSPLGKAEWVVAIAEIAGCREAGEKFFSEIPARYNHLKELAASATSKPKVMLNTPYADSWYMPSTDSYMARLIDDAAGDYLYDRNTDNTSAVVDNEEAYLMAASADRWINVGQFYSLKELHSRYPKLTSIECVKSGNVFNCTRRLSPRGGNDFWESGVIRPDIILSDLIKIFHPELSLPATDESQPEGELYYYTQLE